MSTQNISVTSEITAEIIEIPSVNITPHPHLICLACIRRRAAAAEYQRLRRARLRAAKRPVGGSDSDTEIES